jgi:hypothetical protein
MGALKVALAGREFPIEKFLVLSGMHPASCTGVSHHVIHEDQARQARARLSCLAFDLKLFMSSADVNST